MSIVTLNFSATVAASDVVNVAVGDIVTGTVEYDDTQHIINGVAVFAGSAKEHSFSFTDTTSNYANEFFGGSAVFTITMSNNGETMLISGKDVAGNIFSLTLTTTVSGTNILPTPTTITNYALTSGSVSLV